MTFSLYNRFRDLEKVRVDKDALEGYLGASSTDGVLRTSAPMTYTDGGNYITLGLDTTADYTFGTINAGQTTLAGSTLADDARGLSSIFTLSADPAKSDGIGFYSEGHIGDITTDGPTYGAGAWLNIDSGATLGGDVRAFDIGIYERGADCTGGNAYGLAIHLDFDSTNPPVAIYPFRLNCEVSGATPDALIFAANKAALGITETTYPGIPNDYLKIETQGGTTYRMPVVREGQGLIDLNLFGESDVGDTSDGKALYVHRKAAEFDKYIKTYIDQYGNPKIDIQQTGGVDLLNVCIGTDTGSALTTGYENTFIGTNAGRLNVDGYRNAGVGYNALASCVDGWSNLALGRGAGEDLTSGSNNAFVGTNAGASVTSGSSNMYLGAVTGNSNLTGDNNVAIGLDAGKAHTGSYGIYIGSRAGIAAISAGNCLFIGYEAGKSITTGGDNIFIGNSAGRDTATNVTQNIAIGYRAGRYLEGGRNLCIGWNSAYLSTSMGYSTNIGYRTGYYNVTGDYNVLVGSEAGFGATGNSHSNNTYIGRESGYSVTTGSNNTFVGYQSGKSITSGAANVCLGYMAGETNLTTGNNQLWIANSNTATPLIYGEFDTPLLKVTGTYGVVGVTNLGDGGTTNYASFAADGELNLFGTARVLKQIPIANANLGKGSTAPSQVILGNYNGWEYTIGDDTVFTFHLPHNWASGTDVEINIDWYIDEAGGDEIKWRIDWAATPHTATEAVDAPTHTGNSDTGDIVVPATVRYLTQDALTIPGASLTSNDQVGVKVSRIAITDGTNPGNDPAIIDLHIEYTVDKLGEATI